MDAPPTDNDKPPKIRTWWHPVFASTLRWQLDNHYQLDEEVPVGRKPLQIDILLVQKRGGELPDPNREILAGLAEYFNEITLVEFKSPSDTLRTGDLQTFLAYALLYRSQNDPLLAPEKVTLIVVAPSLTKAYREEMRVLSVTPHEEQPGIWSLQGGPIFHRTWILETSVLAGVDHPLLTLFSPQILKDRQGVYAQMRAAGYNYVMVYLTQQIRQFNLRGEDFAMQHLGTEDEMKQVLADLMASFPVEERIVGVSQEELVKSISPEVRVKGLSPEARLQGITLAEREELRRLLDQPPSKEADSFEGM